MGQWSWIRLQGKGNQITRVIALYCPCPLDGPLSMYQQHSCSLAKLGQNECPCKAILSDLESELLSWQEAGNMIIVLTDFNEDVQIPWIWQFFASINLIKAISTITGSPLMATHNWDTMLIDGIYMSPDLLSEPKKKLTP